MSTPHNPAGLTEAQYGRDQGYRLLEVDEIDTTAKLPSINEIEMQRFDETWGPGSSGSMDCFMYRTRLSREALAAARGLTPASEPGKADAFDAWLDTEEGQGLYEKLEEKLQRIFRDFLASREPKGDA